MLPQGRSGFEIGRKLMLNESEMPQTLQTLRRGYDPNIIETSQKAKPRKRCVAAERQNRRLPQEVWFW